MIGPYSANLPLQASILFNRDYAHVLSVTLILELDHAFCERKKGVVLPQSDVETRMHLCPSLTNDYIPGIDKLAVVPFYTQPLANAVPAVLAAALALFMGK